MLIDQPLAITQSPCQVTRLVDAAKHFDAAPVAPGASRPSACTRAITQERYGSLLPLLALGGANAA